MTYHNDELAILQAVKFMRDEMRVHKSRNKAARAAAVEFGAFVAQQAKTRI